MIDVNVNLSRWPFRRLPCDETPKLVEKLRSHRVTQAWASSFDGLLHRDVDGVNARLVHECCQHGHGLLLPFGTVNLKLPDWQEDVRRIAEQYRMPGIRLHPNYHGYALDDPVFPELLALAERYDLIVQLAVRMEDPRTQHPLMQIPDVDLKPLPDLLADHPKLRLVLLNSFRSLGSGLLTQLAESGNVFFEIAMLEGVGGVGNLLKTVPLRRILFGSHFPFFNLESALLKLRESNLSPSQIKAVSHSNAQRLLTV